MEETTQPESDLEFVKSQFENWRATRKGTRARIPEELWAAAIEVAQGHSVSIVAKALRLSHADLKKRVLGNLEPSAEDVPPSFFELKHKPPATPSDCIIELEDRSGIKMKMSFRGGNHQGMLDLAKAIWANRA